MAMDRDPAYSSPVKQKKHSPDQGRNSAGEPAPAATAPLSQNEINFVPAPEEVARRAYFSYVNQGSSQGHEVQHWLEAEKQLLAERERTRTHGFPKPT
jgi:hypothetical protein